MSSNASPTNSAHFRWQELNDTSLHLNDGVKIKFKQVPADDDADQPVSDDGDSSIHCVVPRNKPAWISQHVFDTCKDRCEMISSSRYKNSDVVVFHAPTLYLGTPLKKYRGQTWVFHDMEPPSLVPNFKRWKRLFNWTLSYRRDADIFNPYSTFTRRTDAEKNDIHKIDWNNKTRNIGWIVSHCGVASQRLKYGEKLKQTIDVDAFGRCGKLHCPRGQWQECLGKYKFYASFENSLCTDYITEKSFRVFERNVDSIPVTRGAPDYSMFLPPGSFVNTRNFSSTSNLDDKPTVMKYFKWRRYYKANDQIDNGPVSIVLASSLIWRAIV
ncbi:Alpha-(1,3)-fucosyltransferase C [Mizuhopecten yessoensis]|uniref:Fucosyltransferase n=1 Tax=Mizuhopecten yessoensis TaxID=6573 RepID=A0A210QEY3_MIZYE|nr:Alpha-(1,3)-fucosyltransferase C [Mizuhopecten yessoensis]